MRILVAGAGPAGSRISEKLAINSIDVTLVDQLKTSKEKNFSSAVVPIATINSKLIPKEAVSTFWNGWQIFDPEGNRHEWISDSPIGAVLDFSRLREILWSKSLMSGVNFLPGWKLISVDSRDDYANVQLIDDNGQIRNGVYRWIVDATGAKRQFIQNQFSSNYFLRNIRNNLIQGSGIEWILRTDKRSMLHWKNKITFFLGTKYIEYGYGWIFPMANNCLKVGLCSLPPTSAVHPPLFPRIKQFLTDLGLINFEVIEKHSGYISSSLFRKEKHINGRVLGVGDSISTANLLGGEGIRHALISAELLAELLSNRFGSGLSTNINTDKMLLNYKKDLDQLLGWRWKISNRIGKRTWWSLSDKKADQRITGLINELSKKMSAEDISALLFDYRFERYGFKFLPYLIGWR